MDGWKNEYGDSKLINTPTILLERRKVEYFSELKTSHLAYRHISEYDKINLVRSIEQDGIIQTEPTMKEMYDFCQSIRVPFPIETNPNYNCWWRLLHEIGHWAIKPDWYNEWGGQLSKIKFVDDTKKSYYAGNDQVPNISMYHIIDPTPQELQVRMWCLGVLNAKGWPHPIDLNDITKPATANLWSLNAGKYEFNEIPDQSLESWGIDPTKNKFRPVQDGFNLPFEDSHDLPGILANMSAIASRYYGSSWWKSPQYHNISTPQEKMYWMRSVKLLVP